MPSDQSPVTIIGQTDTRYQPRTFGIQAQDRLSHLYVVGQTGTGKSTLLQQMLRQDALRGAGFCLIDPHGDLASGLADAFPDATYWRVGDPKSPFGYNPLVKTHPALRPLLTSALIETLRAQWSDAWGVRMEHLLRFALLGLLDTPAPSLQDIIPLFTDKDARTEMLRHVHDDEVRRFWIEEWGRMNYKTAVDGVAPIANKLGAFMANPMVRRSLTEPEEPLRLRRAMDQGQGLIVNLEKGRIGSDLANVVGGLLVSALVHASFTRTDTAADARGPFHLYIDEFHNFTTETVASLLSETRKYGLSATLAQQFTNQGIPAVLQSILGNVGSLISFRVGAEDMALVSRQLGLTRPEDLIHLPNHHALARIMVDGHPSRAFSIRTLPVP